MGKIFNKGLSEDDKKEGLFKRLKNIEGKNEVQLQAIKDQGEKQLREIKNINKSNTLKVIDEIRRRNDETNKILLEVKKIDTKLDTAELVCTKTDGTKYNFNTFALSLKFVEKIFNYEITLDEAKDDQDKLEKLIIRLEKYKPKINLKKEEKNKVLESAVNLFDAGEDIIGFFEKGIFLFKGNVFKTKEEIEEEFTNNTLTFIEKKSKEIICFRYILIFQHLLI